MKRINILLVAIVLLYINHAMAMDILLNRYIILEINETLFDSKSFALRVSKKEYDFEFLILKSEKIESINQDSIVNFDSFAVDSLINIFQSNNLTSNTINILIKDKNTFIKYSCANTNIFKSSMNKIYVLVRGDWHLEADFSLPLTGYEDCHHDIIPNIDTLILTRITYEFGKKIFEFKKCVPNSLEYYLVKYIEDFGRVQIEYPTEGTAYIIDKINNLSVEQYLNMQN
jgi:hypothetical protein